MKLKMVSLLKFCGLFICLVIGTCLVASSQSAGLVFLIIGFAGIALQVFNILTIISYDKNLFNKSFGQFYKDRCSNIKAWFSSIFGAKKEKSLKNADVLSAEDKDTLVK